MSTLLFVHGSGCTGDAFAHQLPEFDASIAPNLPGHAAPGSGASVAEFADFIEASIDERKLEDVVLCGNSLGGAIALEVALRRNTAVVAIVLLGSGSRLKVAPVFLEGLKVNFEATARQLAGYMFADPTPERLAYAVESMERVGAAQTLRDFEACNAFDVTERLAELSLPVLALTGELDAMTPPKYAHALAGRVPRCEVRIVPGAGHLVMMERPAETNDALRIFVQQVGSL